ncbi:glycoside hydrolase family 43 protein [Patellaria atrata CBS 101060]|uniref:Glycoside hydrolase family 43 protein n=1 Tax=Patellaria atrata CBS 101060 TaxID=1346257 RepID=A0A9P4SHI1_9PEZI|nr:glycoside hydrolase family 43 protein [Patellaria atrata CBS 101060]
MIQEPTNSTFQNPIFPGFFPDPSCIFVEEWDLTFFCASSSFNAFPGIPIHASKDLKNWKLISNALNRHEQLPVLALTNGSTSGIWASTIRYHDGTFYVITTLEHDKKATDDPTRHDNMIFKSEDPFDPTAWSNPVHFEFEGYDPSPFWHDDGTVYIHGAHIWQVSPGIYQNTIDLETGELGGPWISLWNGTGGLAPEGPHIYRKDGWYYLLAAEGGTGVDHMVTMARSRSINGPFEANPANPVLTNANTTSYFQTLGHADLFQDENENWWAVALSTRSGPEYVTYPMGRETVMTPVTWDEGKWPVFSRVQGEMSGWEMPDENLNLDGHGPWVGEPDVIDFEPGSGIPSHFLYWRLPIESSYTVSPQEHPRSLRVRPSKLNLTAYDGNYAGAGGQSFIGRRQTDTLFTWSVDMDFSPNVRDEEAGMSVFLTMNHHIRLGVVLLPSDNSTSLTPHFRFHAISYIPTPPTTTYPVPAAWVDKKLHLEIKAFNLTHYSFSAGPASSMSEMRTIAYAGADIVSWGFTGALLGVYATSNGGNGTTPAYFENWRYQGQGQFMS